MSRGVKTQSEIAKARIDNSLLETFKEGFIIIPYLISGYIDVSNRGYVLSTVDNIAGISNNINDYETYKRVWTGADAVIIN
ncbi:MAG: hypothetical protein ACRCYA_07590 [Cetobacterium sp.]|uniref:hypothetical protein n=1 Tax=Cetobacterium sp. TaxID=2071632 RepID=UPI003F402609